MTLSTDTILARIKGGEDLGSIVRSQLPPGDRETLKRCAAVRSFDAALFKSVLRDRRAKLRLEALVERRYVERVPGTDRFRVVSDQRSALMEAWWTDAEVLPMDLPSDLRSLSGQLADRYRSSDPIEALYHLVLVDQGAARQRFEALFGDADSQFDLATCQDVIDAVSGPERLAVLEPEFAAVRPRGSSIASSRDNDSTRF